MCAPRAGFDQTVRSLVPDRLRANWLSWYGPEQVAELVSGTHERAVAAIEQWGLDDVQPLGDGQVAVVCSCRYRGQPAVLKVSPRRRDQTHRRHETEALRLWTGLAPQVLAARDDGWTALLERVDPGVPLAFCRPRLQALQILGEVAQKLHRYPAGTAFPSLATNGIGRNWRENLQRRPDALAELEELLATTGRDVLLHLDLHTENVLSDGERWRVIDPKPHRGDRHAECFVFLSLADELPRHDAATTLDEWISCFCTGAGLDEQRLRRWISVLAQAELGWWPNGNSGWGADITHLVEALDAPP